MYPITDPKSPLKKNTQTGVYEATVTTTDGLQTVFNYCEGLQYEDKLLIRIANGCSPILTHRAIPLKSGYSVPICCSSVTIIGEGKDSKGNRVPNKIYLDKHLTDGYVRDENGNIRKNDEGKDIRLCDSIISIEGASVDKRVSVHIENLEFMPIGFQKGSSLANFVPSDDDFCMFDSHLIKIFWGDGINLYNVKSALANGAITNVDLRTVKNVVVRDCEFVNYNAIKPGNKIGGNLWLRGSVENVLIANNKLEKFGNDEILAIFGNDYGIDSKLRPIPTMAIKYIEQRNITIVNNSIIYKRPSMANEILGVGEIVLNEVFISFIEGTKNDGTLKGGIMHDILVANNNIEILHPVRQVFTFWYYNTHIDVFNFRICNNTIRHSYVNTATSEYAIDFFFGGGESTGYTTSGEMEIAYNTIKAEEDIPSSVNGHCFVQNAIANLYVHDNNFHAAETAHFGNAGSVLLRCTYGSQSNRFVRNNVICHYTAVVRSVEPGETINIDFTNNYFNATRSILVQASAIQARTFAFNLRMENNYIETPDYYLLSREFAPSGSIWASGNVWYTLPTPAGSSYTAANMCYLPKGTASHVQRLTILGNVVTGARKLADNPDFPAADQKAIANNDF